MGKKLGNPEPGHGDPEATHVTFASSKVGHIDLALFPSLRKLELRHLRALQAIDGWASSPVETVWAKGCPRWHHVELASAPALKSLSIDQSPRTLTLPPTLQKLRASLVQVSSIEPLPKGLRRLHLEYPGTLSFTHLRELTHLTLGFAHEFADVSALATLTQLRQLALRGMNWSLRSLAGLSDGFTKLEQLGVHDAVELLELGWKSAPPLRRLEIRRAKKFAHLEGLDARALTEVTLDGCWKLAGIEPLAGATKLQKLSLRSCKALTDLSPVAELPLTSLELGASGVASHDKVPDALLPVTKPVSLRRRTKEARAAKKAPKPSKAKRALVKKLRRLLKAEDDLAMAQGLELTIALDDPEAREALLGGVVAGTVPRVERWMQKKRAPRFLPDPAPALVPNDVFEGGASTRRRRAQALRWLVARVGDPSLRRSVQALTLSGYQRRGVRFPVSLQHLERFEQLASLYVIHAAGVTDDGSLQELSSLRRLFVEDAPQSSWMPRSDHLHELGFARTGALESARLAGLPALRALTIVDAHLDSFEGVARRAALRELTALLPNALPAEPLAALPLEQLTIRASASVRDVLPKIPTLRSLSLHYDYRLGPPQNLIAAIAKLPRLESLATHSVGLETLAPLAGHPTLRRVVVRGQSLTRADAQVLEELPALTYLDTKTTKFGGHRFSKRLRAMRPD